MNWKIPLFRIYWDDKDIHYVNEAIQAGMDWSIGPNIAKFEDMIADYVGTKYCVVFNSGTSALHSQLLAHNIGVGDEVIVPSFTFIATVNSLLFVGAKPVFADIEEQTFGLDPEDVKKKLTSRTKAIMPMHYGGGCCQVDELAEVAKDAKVLLLEDGAESLGASLDGKKVGSFGESAMYSFSAPKVITTGEGGAIVTNSEEIYERMKLVRSHGRLEREDYFSSTEPMDYIQLGYNFRMSNITAALGIAQLSKINEIIEMRRNNSKEMIQSLSKCSELILPRPATNAYSTFQMFTLRILDSSRRDGLKDYLKSKGIMSKVYFDPVHKSHFYRNVLKYTPDLPVTEEMSKQVLTLPMYPALTTEEIDFIASSVKEYFGE